MAWTVEWSKPAIKSLRRLDRKQAELIVRWVAANLDGCENPRTVGDCKPLQGTDNGWRWRVGRIRILAEIKDNELMISVCRVGQREGVYRKI